MLETPRHIEQKIRDEQAAKEREIVYEEECRQAQERECIEKFDDAIRQLTKG